MKINDRNDFEFSSLAKLFGPIFRLRCFGNVRVPFSTSRLWHGFARRLSVLASRCLACAGQIYATKFRLKACDAFVITIGERHFNLWRDPSDVTNGVVVINADLREALMTQVNRDRSYKIVHKIRAREIKKPSRRFVDLLDPAVGPPCFPADLSELKGPTMGPDTFEATQRWRCPDMNGSSRSIRKVAAYFANRGGPENFQKAKKSLDSLEASTRYAECLSAEEKQAVRDELVRIGSLENAL